MLSGKTILITGASKGIGAATARLFCRQGANLILIARNKSALELLKADLLQINSEAEVDCFECDVREQSMVKAVFSQLNQQGILLDGMVNNAGVMTSAMLMLMKPEELYLNFETNVYGTFYITQLAIKHFIKKKKGFVINLTSIIGIEGFKGQTAYSASKSAIIGFTKSLSKELASLQIRVNAIAPGFIDTEMTAAISRDEIIKNIPLGKIGTPEDVANTALFLASDLSSYITGQIIGVDGGMII
jgi:3-oxoacyl-[acyl-carrier protein] reductase